MINEIWAYECINLEIKIDGKLCNLICLHMSPTQNRKQFHAFLKNVELNLEVIFNKNPYLTVAIGDFNVKSRNCYKGNELLNLSHQNHKILPLATNP